MIKRVFKPVAFGVTIMMIGLAVAGVFNLGDYEHPTFQTIGALFPLAAAGLLAWGWYHSDTRWTRYGLLVATFAYLGRTLFLIWEDPLGDSVLLALGTTVIIAGSYVMETQNIGRR